MELTFLFILTLFVTWLGARGWTIPGDYRMQESEEGARLWNFSGVRGERHTSRGLTALLITVPAGPPAYWANKGKDYFVITRLQRGGNYK